MKWFSFGLCSFCQFSKKFDLFSSFPTFFFHVTRSDFPPTKNVFFFDLIQIFRNSFILEIETGSNCGGCSLFSMLLSIFQKENEIKSCHFHGDKGPSVAFFPKNRILFYFFAIKPSVSSGTHSLSMIKTTPHWWIQLENGSQC